MTVQLASRALEPLFSMDEPAGCHSEVILGLNQWGHATAQPYSHGGSYLPTHGRSIGAGATLGLEAPGDGDGPTVLQHRLAVAGSVEKSCGRAHGSGHGVPRGSVDVGHDGTIGS